MSAAKEVKWSDFIRNPSSVESMLEGGDVILRRRDGDPLRLTRKAEDSAGSEALAMVARLLGPRLSDVDAPMAAKRIPWTRFLPDTDRAIFLREFVQRFEECADLGNFGPLDQLVVEWKATASLHAEGLAKQLQRRIDEVGGPVPAPRR